MTSHVRRAWFDVAAGGRDLGLASRMLPWSAVLPVLKYTRPLPVLAASMWIRRQDSNAPAGVEIRRVARIAHRVTRFRPLPHRDNCLERSLLAYRYLSRAGADPRLVVGVRKDGEAVAGHVWVEVDGEPVAESREALEGFAPVVAFGANGIPEHIASVPPGAHVEDRYLRDLPSG